MSRRASIGLGAILAVAGFALGHATASLSTARPERAERVAARFADDEVRREIYAQITQPDSLANAAALAQLLQELGPDALPALKPTLRDPSENLGAPEALLLMQAWVDLDPQSAATWAAGFAPPGYATLALSLAVERLAEDDPRAALRFATGGPLMNPALLKPLVRGWVRSGQPGLEDWIRAYGRGFERQKALGAMAREMIRRDGVEATAAWADALTDTEDGFLVDAHRRVAIELTYADPAAGVAWYEKHRDGPLGEDLIRHVGNAWVAIDGPAAMQWLSQLPAGPQRDGAVRDAIQSWIQSDTDALLRWGGSMGPDGIPPWLQPGLAVYAKYVAFSDPTEGIRFAERIADEKQRRLTLIQIAQSWHLRDPAAAEAWLEGSPLSEDDRARARKPPSSPRADDSAG